MHVVLTRVSSVVAIVLIVAPLAAAPPARYLRLADVTPVLTQFAETLPPPLAALLVRADEATWAAWNTRRDAEVRARLAAGDQETIVNWLMFGTTFTRQPRAVATAGATLDLGAVINGRLDDLLAALAAPGSDERRLFARRFFETNGFRPDSEAGRAELRGHLVRAIQRLAAEEEERRAAAAAVRATGNRAEELALSQRMFWNRGLSLDTTLAPNFAIEQALAALQAKGQVAAGSIRRIGVIGPGLDFADKNAGFDAYPIQTVQPFAVLDSVRRLGMAAADVEVIALDLSPRILGHLAAAHTRPDYVLHLPLARDQRWTPGFRAYWTRFGDRIGVPTSVPPDRALEELAELRAVRVAGDTVRRVSGLDLNVISETWDDGRFDLVIVTNVLLYYDGLDQAVALSSITTMLRPGGHLLSNTILPEVNALPMRLGEIVTTPYTAAQDADVVLVYRRIQ